VLDGSSAALAAVPHQGTRSWRRKDDQRRRCSTSQSQHGLIYHDWDKALSENDAQGLLKLYAIESALIPHLLGRNDGVCHGTGWLRFFDEVIHRKPPMRRYYRTGYMSDGGNRLIFKYPRAAPEEQMDFVEVIELNGDGVIQYHKVYRGWRGFAILQNNRYPRPA
jgi:hypothetical protein